MLVSVALLSTLFLKSPEGNVYQAVNEIPPGTCVMSNDEELVYEVSNFNTCNQVVLAPGCYRAELRGGIGVANSACVDHAAQNQSEMVSALFSLSAETTVYALRGGDGNPGTVNVASGLYGSFGGGASGVDSILVVGDRVWRAYGGVGRTCVVPNVISAGGRVNSAVTAVSVANGNGFGGGENLPGHENGMRTFLYGTSSGIKVAFSIGGGGGGAPSGTAGTDWYLNSAFPRDDIVINPGINGSADGGGDGGDVVSCVAHGCEDLVTLSGGRGGRTVSFECGGAVAVSYGGGGGGAAHSSYKRQSLDGGDGGSGSTGTSDVSFLRIYKM